MLKDMGLSINHHTTSMMIEIRMGTGMMKMGRKTHRETPTIANSILTTILTRIVMSRIMRVISLNCHSLFSLTTEKRGRNKEPTSLSSD